MEKFTDPEHAQDFLQILDILTANTNRIGIVAEVASMVMKQAGVTEEKEKTVIFGSEIHRLIIVYSHAMLEDGLREIVRSSLKYNLDLQLPNYFNFVGTNSPKITLGELRTNYNERMVDDIVRESIDSHLDNVSFSSTQKIEKHLKIAGVQIPENVRKIYFPVLRELCLRRHQIVHKVDVETNFEGRKLETVMTYKVNQWLGMTISFLFEVFRITLPNAYRSRLDPQIDKQVKRVWESYGLGNQANQS